MRAIGLGALVLLAAPAAWADEGGASVWLPGQFASFAASPTPPGFSLDTTFYVRHARAVEGDTFFRGGGAASGLSISEGYFFLTPGYAFADPVLGGQLFLSLTFSVGHNETSASGTIEPDGSARPPTVDSLTGISDLFAFGSLKWQRGEHNFMAYTAVGIPTAAYDPERYSGLGVGHWAIDAGGAYTLETTNGFELSLTAGLTYNFVNPTTGYKSGIDGHVDVAASYALSDSVYVGAAGYLYDQLTPDSGGAVELGDFRSRGAGIGPQIGGSFQLGATLVDVNLRGYAEFLAHDRPEGWSVFLSVSFARARHLPPARR